MEDKWAELEQRYQELGERLAQLQIARDVPELKRVSRIKARLEKPVSLYREWKRLGHDLTEGRVLLEEAHDEELAQEMEEMARRREQLAEELVIALLPRDENDDKDVIIEIRAGTGGDEAAIFAGDLLRMYSRYADSRGWKVELMSATEAEMGGYKEVIVSAQGTEAYSHFKHESGVHRVQRVPQTESSGRIHTSTATVAVMPEVEEVDVEINTNDLEIDTYRASGPGGQHMQKNETAVRITHKPTGIVVASQSQRSQGQNKTLALRVLRARIQEKAQEEAKAEIAATRKLLVGTGDRGEKIRTYNYLQDRITDHRVKRDWHGIPAILNGDLGDIVEALRRQEREELLRQVAEEAAAR